MVGAETDASGSTYMLVAVLVGATFFFIKLLLEFFFLEIAYVVSKILYENHIHKETPYLYVVLLLLVHL